MIIYFTGTGNSLYAAKKIGSSIGEKVCHIADVRAESLAEEKVLGIVFPVYYYEAPLPVRRFLAEMKLRRDAYVFSVATCGGGSGTSLNTVKKLVEKAGGRLSLTAVLKMPDNFCIAVGGNPNEQFMLFDTVDRKLKGISAAIKKRMVNLPYTGLNPLGTVLNIPAVYSAASKMVRLNVDTEKCIGCGICVKVCPENNIALSKGKAVIRGNCCSCFGCVHACRNQAVRIGKKPTLPEKQYRCQDITLKELFRRDLKTERENDE